MPKRIISILIFIFCVFVPVWVLSFFPTPCGYGLCLLFYYPIIFAVGLISGWTYYELSDKIKLNKGIQVILLLALDISVLAYFYPRGEFFPTNQISEAKRVIGQYGELKPTDIFEATEKRDFLLITALYHKFKLPKETYTSLTALLTHLEVAALFLKHSTILLKTTKYFQTILQFTLRLT